jgi:hypothetical protein
MGLSNPRIVFGIHSVTPYSRSTGLPYGILKVLNSANLSLEADNEKLYAGSNPFPWASEPKVVNTEFAMKVKASPGFLFTLMMGANVTDAGADTAGTVSTLTNKNGSSLMHATTGIASVAVKAAQKANLKFGKYVLKVLTSTTVGVYALHDVDLDRGTDVAYSDDNLLLALATVTIASGADTDIDSLGLALTGGSGIIGMTTGDTATFEVLPPSTTSTSITIGASGTLVLPEFGAILTSQKRGTGEMFEVDCPRVQGQGFPLNFAEKAFQEIDVKMSLLWDSTANKLCSIRHIVPS